MNIHPLVGVGPARFGMTPDQVVSALKEPQVYEDWMSGNLNSSLVYHGMILGFDRCASAGPLPDSRLCEVRMCGRQDAKLFERGIATWTVDTMEVELSARSIAHERHANGDLSVPSLGLALSFSDEGVVEYVEMWRPR